MKRIGNKDQTIRDVISRLTKRMGNDAFHIVDHWDSDRCAIGVSAPTNHAVLAYIQTFGKKNGRYDVHLELPPKDKKKFPYSEAGIHPQVSFTELMKIIKNHFKKTEAQPPASGYVRSAAEPKR